MILPGRTDEAHIIEALELGADDYLTKPFGSKELVARIRVSLRHRLQQQGEKSVFKVDDLVVDLLRRIVKVGNEEVKLTPREYDILRVLAQQAGNVLTRALSTRQIWGAIGGRPEPACARETAAPEGRTQSRATLLRSHGNRGRLPPAGS